MENDKKWTIIVEKLFNNCLQITNFLQLSNISLPNKVEENKNNDDSTSSKLTQIISSITIYYFSNFKCKVNPDGSLNSSNDFTNFLNDTLTLANSKFIVSEKITKIEFINFILFFLSEFDFINEYIEYLNKINRKYINVNLESLIGLNSEENYSNKNIRESEINNPHFLQTFNKFNFTCKNLKKQVDSFINLSFKLNEIQAGQETPINNIKIEEFLLFHENLFQLHQKSIKSYQNYLENRFMSISKILSFMEESYSLYDNFISSAPGSLTVIKNINTQYDQFNKNIQFKKIKKLFQIKMKEIMINNTNLMGGGISSNFLFNWIEKLEEKLSQQLGKIKRDHLNLFQDNQISNNFTNIAIELENFIAYQMKEIKSYIETQFEQADDGSNNLEGLLLLFKEFCINISQDSENSLNVDPDQIFENKLFLKSSKVLEIIYQYYTQKFEEINLKFTDQISEKFDIYNLKLDK